MNELRSKLLGKMKAEASPLVQPKQTKRADRAAGLTSIPVKREETRTTNLREGDRHWLNAEQGRVTHEGESYDAQLVNLSGGGAMIACELQPNLWDRIELHLGDGGSVECAVRWVKDGRIGLEFEHETRIDCGAEQRVALLRDVIAKSFPDVELELSLAADEAESSPAPKEGEHRRDRRHPLIWSGLLHHDYQSTPVRLRNISETGAMIECEALLPVGSEPLLDLGDAGSIFATVSWRVGDQAGLKFNEPFDLTRLAASRPEVAPGRWTAPNYLRQDSAPATPWADEWGRMSLGELRDELEGFIKR